MLGKSHVQGNICIQLFCRGRYFVRDTFEIKYLREASLVIVYTHLGKKVGGGNFRHGHGERGVEKEETKIEGD